VPDYVGVAEDDPHNAGPSPFSDRIFQTEGSQRTARAHRCGSADARLYRRHRRPRAETDAERSPSVRSNRLRRSASRSRTRLRALGSHPDIILVFWGRAGAGASAKRSLCSQPASARQATSYGCRRKPHLLALSGVADQGAGRRPVVLDSNAAPSRGEDCETPAERGN